MPKPGFQLARVSSVPRRKYFFTPRTVSFATLDCFGKSELKFCFSHLLSVMTTATNDFKERRGA